MDRKEITDRTSLKSDCWLVTAGKRIHNEPPYPGHVPMSGYCGTRHTAPSLRLFVPISLTVIASPTSPKYPAVTFCYCAGFLVVTPVVLYGCETWSLTVREEHKLRVFENRVLRRIFGPKRDGVTGGWRKMHNEELHNLYLHQV
jgi:hypothetical protein